MAARVRLRAISSAEGNRLLRIVRRTSGSVVTWQRAQIVLLAAQGMAPPKISEVVFTDPDTVRDVIHFANGRLAEMWGVVDVFSQMKQLGVIPA